ncbi:P-loop NTPase [Pseudomonas sp.]|uniref:P-loop NTPase n=1 Tax=Pseudomonas sp. TaxID=306 RepID=UPI003FD88022
MCELIRKQVKTRRQKSLPAFEQVIKDKSGAELYQTALRWLQGNVSQHAVNAVIGDAVRGARKPGANSAFPEDGEPAEWHLPQGTMQLAELVNRFPDDFPGPILTTNFDPLLSLAIRAAGGRSQRRIVDGDGNIGREAESDPGTRTVAHLHGYWRASDTLHTPAQLTALRPRLKASLQSILRKKTLVVVAYSGWDDVFTSALAEILLDEDTPLDVLWCFRENDPQLVATRYARLIERMQPAIARGVFRAYGGVDCHHIFGEVMAEQTSSPVPSEPLDSPLPGWECLDTGSLSVLAPLSEGEARRYYDGAVPEWRHASSDLVPRREAATLIAERRSQLEGDSASLQLIRAAGGEGKTTLLLQAAVHAARNEDVRILWRPSPKFCLSPEHVISLSADFQWLIVADDAENLVKAISESARLLRQAGRANVDFLLAARDSDWKASGGDREGWAQWLQYQPDLVLRGISAIDARAVVDAWSRAGGLRKLAAEDDTERRSVLLLEAVNDQVAQEGLHREDGSFFGGLLAVRFGEAGLRAHVREFLAQLRAAPIASSDKSLAEALLYVAACHGAGIKGLDEKVLSDLLGVPRDWVRSRVVRPLGEEAAAVSGGDRVFTRHSQVAAAVLLEAEAALDVDLADIWAQIVKQTVATHREVHVAVFAPIVHASSTLQARLPQQMPQARRKAIAISAGVAAVNAKTEWLGTVVDLGRTYRNANELNHAVQLFRRELKQAPAKTDFNYIIRGYWCEWGVCEASLHREGASQFGAWLQGLSLSDRLSPAILTAEQIKLNCAGIGVAFGRLATSAADCPFARAYRATIDIARRVPLDARAEGYFDRYERAADKLHIPHPKDLSEAVVWFTEGINAIGESISDEELLNLVHPGNVSFDALHTMLKRPDRSA